MAEIYVSPGVYVRERDFSYYVSSVGNSALALIGETKKGPAFSPTLMSNMNEFREIFGNLDPNKHVGYCAKSFFKYANQAYIVRVLGDDVLRGTNAITAIVDSADTVLATLLVSAGTVVTVAADVASASADTNFKLVISGAVDGDIYSGTVNLVNTSAPNYIGTLFPRDNTVGVGSQQVALQHVFSLEADGKVLTTGATTVSAIASGEPLYVDGYSNARTPVIVGDTNGVNAGTPLFTIYTISDGQEANRDVKIAIENINSTTKTFDIVVRQYGDTNASPVILERFVKLTMDKTDSNYLLKQIGDSRDETGEYPLISRYIFVEVYDSTIDYVNQLPYGFSRIAAPIHGDADFPEFTMVSGYTTSTTLSRQNLGVDYLTTDPDLFMYGHSSAWDLEATVVDAYIKGYHLNSAATTVHYQAGPSAITEYTTSQAKFLVPVLGGNDGWIWSSSTRDLLNDTPSATEETQWKAAIDTIKSTETYDINLMAVPGVAVTNPIGTYAIEIAEDRADTFYVGDFPDGYETSAGAAALTASIDSSYAGTYWPYVRINDSDNQQVVLLPPTAQVLEALAYTDNISYPWFAAAGMNRGVLTDVVSVKYKLNQNDRETLYDAKINPVVSFAGQGMAIWGQKTLQTRTTALDRVNVRRMMIYVEKVIAGASKYLVFEQNDETTWDRFKGMVQPILDNVKIKRGLIDFRVIMDETTNTPDMIDRNQMVGKIYIKPTKTAEVITIDFNLMAQGASFDEG